jgi:hypothetical protein
MDNSADFSIVADGWLDAVVGCLQFSIVAGCFFNMLLKYSLCFVLRRKGSCEC